MNDDPHYPGWLRERQPGPHTSMWATWPPLRILALIAMLVAGNFMLQIIVYSLGGGLFLPVLVGAVGGVVIPLRYVAAGARLPIRADFSLHRPSPVVLLAAGLVAVATLSPTSLLARLNVLLHPINPQWLDMMNQSLPRGPVEIALAYLTVVVAAPLAEELVFRALLHRLTASLWGPWAGAILSAIVFGIIHFEPWYVFGLIGIGFVLAIVYEATGSVLACWITHAAHNGISLTMMILQDNAADETAPLGLVDLLIAAGSVLLLVLLLSYLWQGRSLRRT